MAKEKRTAVLYSNTPPSPAQEQKFVEFLSEKYGEAVSLIRKKPANKKSSPKQDLSEENFAGSR